MWNRREKGRSVAKVRKSYEKIFILSQDTIKMIEESPLHWYPTFREEIWVWIWAEYLPWEFWNIRVDYWESFMRAQRLSMMNNAYSKIWAQSSLAGDKWFPQLVGRESSHFLRGQTILPEERLVLKICEQLSRQ